MVNTDVQGRNNLGHDEAEARPATNTYLYSIEKVLALRFRFLR